MWRGVCAKAFSESDFKVRERLMVVAGFYTDGQYLKNNPGWHLDAALWKANAIRRMLQRNHIHPQTVCDVGCGVGEILRLLQQDLEPTSTLLGYDIAPYAIEKAKTQENERLHFKLGDFLEEEKGHFDLLLMIGVLEHFENLFQVLRDIKEKSEYKMFLLPLDLTLTTVIRNRVINFRHEAGHLHFFTKDVILAIFKDLGYEVIDYFYVLQPLDTTPWSEVKRKPLRLLRKLAKVTILGLQRLPSLVLYAVHKDLAARMFASWRLMVLVK
ncbi:MAG: class I SAM-dependent methyltransferase [Ktedonobacteraceae bacterium]|nr:class I SAM-dependent methyltransferase [Ktedonobacteraceae bacterium]